MRNFRKRATTSHHYAIFSVRFDPFVGGVESFSLSLSKELVKQGHRVTVVTKRIDDSPEAETTDDGIDVVRLPTLSLVNDRLPLSRRNKRHYELLDLVGSQGVTRVLVNNRFYPHSIDGLKFAASIGAPAVMLDHGTAYLTLGSPLVDWAIKKYEHIMTARTKRFHPTYAGISQKSADWLGQFGIKTSIVIPNAIDAESFRSSSSGRNYRDELRIQRGTTMITFVGRLTPEKGGDVLVRAAKRFEGEASFVLAGTGTLGKELESEAGPNVHFLGLVNHRDLSALLQTSDAFCLPTRSEGFCTSLLEAAACGVPAIIPNVGGVQEVISNSDCGIVIDGRSEEALVDGIEKALALGDAGRQAMGENVRQSVMHNCSWPAATQALDRAFLSAV